MERNSWTEDLPPGGDGGEGAAVLGDVACKKILESKSKKKEITAVEGIGEHLPYHQHQKDK